MLVSEMCFPTFNVSRIPSVLSKYLHTVDHNNIFERVRRPKRGSVEQFFSTAGPRRSGINYTGPRRDSSGIYN